jgi:hypothetical protein
MSARQQVGQSAALVEQKWQWRLLPRAASREAGAFTTAVWPSATQALPICFGFIPETDS